MNDNARHVTSIWPLHTAEGVAVRAIFGDGSEPVIWRLTHEQALRFVMDMLDGLRFPKVS